MMTNAPTFALPQLADVLKAADALQTQVHRTPVLTSQRLNQRFACELFFKAEHLQKTGAFKYRGASYAIQQLADDVRGVTTHSSGNHGAALAAAAHQRGIAAHVVMPKNAVKSKIDAVNAYGGTIHFCEPTQQAREAGMAALVAQGYVAIPPYDDDFIIAGQGTAALEFIQHQAELDILVTPVGGGGLYAGSLLAAQQQAGLTVIGAEPAQANDAYRSLQHGQRVSDHQPDTIADGLRSYVGRRNFALIKQYSQGIIPVSETAIVEAMALIWSHLKQVVEPSAATVLAAIAQEPERFRGQRVGVILSGGNVDLTKLPFV
ncbi:MAG: threonine/serine dehydratase [Xanthomonadales bacterium]|jgi:threonine dehydratase|nr:threonine/serine dehydratase [Xanthomonadales bacterium]